MPYLILLAILLFSFSPAEGQRVFATVDPATIQQDLRFDINDFPLVDKVREDDLNFAPNVVFAPDSSKAFVSYTASHKVAVFDPKTGKILKLLELGKNPVLISLTPNGKKLAVVSLFFVDNLPQPGTNQGKLIGSISIIDVQTLEVKTLNLNKVLFSFANNIVFSGDSKTGFAASSGTDELLRFDVDTAAEITPRLKLREGTRPSSLTMARDFSFFTVVLVGSPFLDKRAFPDSVQIVDAASFTVKKSVVPKVETNELAHDFVPVNTVALSPDGKFGVIADQENSSSPLASFPALTRDHALLFDVETGEVVKALDVGGVAGLATLLPDSKTVVVVSELEVAFIDLASQEVKTVSPPSSSFKATTRPTVSNDGTFLFLPAPIDDLLLVYNLKTGELMRFVEVGKKVERDSGGTKITLSAAPLDLSTSPDGKILAALNFNANTIDLLQPQTQRFFIPRVLSTGDWFTGIAVTNNSSQEADIILKGIDQVGVQFQDDNQTQDVVEFVNPVKLKLGAGKQSAFTADRLLQAAPGTTIEGWLELDSDRFEMSSFFMTGDTQLKRLDGGLANFATAFQIVLPEVRVADGFRTEIAVLNPNISLTNVTVGLFNHEGKKLAEINRPLIGGEVISRLVRDPDPNDDKDEGLFAEDSFKDFVNGYITVSSKEGVVAFERYFDGERLSALNGIVTAARDLQLEKTLYLTQIAAFAGSESFLNLVNTGTEKTTIRLALKDNQGAEVTASVSLDLEPGHATRKNVVELFHLTDSGKGVSGWILVESDKPGVVGDAEIHAFEGKGMTTVPAQSILARNFVFSHVAQALGLSTGVALLNPGSVDATVQLEVFTSEGEPVGSRPLFIAAGRREAKLLKEWFSDLPELMAGYIKVSSDREILGLELFFAENFELLSAVPAQIVPPMP